MQTPVIPLSSYSVPYHSPCFICAEGLMWRAPYSTSSPFRQWSMTSSRLRMMYTRELRSCLWMSCDSHVMLCFHSYRATTGTGEMKERDIILDGKRLHICSIHTLNVTAFCSVFYSQVKPLLSKLKSAFHSSWALWLSQSTLMHIRLPNVHAIWTAILCVETNQAELEKSLHHI